MSNMPHTIQNALDSATGLDESSFCNSDDLVLYPMVETQRKGKPAKLHLPTF